MSFDEDSGLLQFGPNVVSAIPAARRVGQLREVLASCSSGSDDRPCYWMYRDVRRASDESVFQRLGIRYDVTVTLPGTIGSEYMKTAGHYHSFRPDQVSTYPEIYEVLSGDGFFLLQRVQDPGAQVGKVVVEDVLLVRGRPGDRLLIPSHHGHVTINDGPRPFVVADLIASASQNHYGAIRQARGAAYYILQSDSGIRIQPNPRYTHLPPARAFGSPREAGLHLSGPPMYQAILDEPGRFSLLTESDSR